MSWLSDWINSWSRPPRPPNPPPSPPSSPLPPYALQRNILYGTQRSSQLLDLHTPLGDGPFPLVITIHGGGFRDIGHGLNTSESAPYLAKGVAVASIGHRLAPRYKHPAQVEDTQLAYDWLVANAGTNKLDASRFAVKGSSSGGFMAAWLAITRPIAAVCVESGMVDLTTAEAKRDSKIRDLLGSFDARKASPVYSITSAFPPTIISHGIQDGGVPIEQARVFAAMLTEKGVEHKLVEYNGGHESPTGEVAAGNIAFLVNHLT